MMGANQGNMMMKRILGLGLALLLAACSDTPEDVTARYALANGAGTLVIKAAANGDARVDSGGQTLIRHDGTEYLLARDAQGAFAARVDDMIAVMGALLREGGVQPTGLGPQPDFALTRKGEETVAGVPGELWVVRAGAASSASAEAVVSTDPELAKVGEALAMQTRLGAAGMEQIQGGRGNLEKAVQEMLAKGMVLRFGPALTLQSLERAPIDPGSFALPERILDRAALKARFDAQRGAAAGQVPGSAPKSE